MSFKQYLVLLMLFSAYLFLGSYLFFAIERPLEEERRSLAKAEAMEIRDLLQRHYAKGLPDAQLELLNRLSEYCGKPFFVENIARANASAARGDALGEPGEGGDDEETFDDKPYIWTFYNSLMFVLCTLSTIGYGNLAPTSRKGRIMDVIYSLIGIPFTGIVLATMAEYFGSLFMRAHHRYKSHEYQTRLSLALDILAYSGLGMVIFIFFPAAIFVYFEDWTFDTGVYYAFVTLATIGYGDLVAGQNGTNTWVYKVYQTMLIVWIMFGLGYMLMIVGFLTRVMRSKKVRKIEHKLAHTIKQTQSKIWNEFSQDVTYLRRMLNEMYLLKIQPVYVEKATEESKDIRRVKSCPNLTEWPVLRKKEQLKDSSSEADEEEMAANFRRIAARRRKAQVENVIEPRIKKTVSEGDLSRIDRKATFGEDAGAIDPKLLLARVVDALGTSVGSKFSLGDFEDGPHRKASSKLNGIHGFSDEEILASEKSQSGWSVGGRRRTTSERQPTPAKRNSLAANDESSRTWGGGVNPADIQKFILMRANGELRRPSGQSYDTRSQTSFSETSQSEHDLKVLPSRMRRMSMAVTSLFQGNKNKPQEPERKDQMRSSKKKRRTGNNPSMTPKVNGSKRLSLPSSSDDPDESMREQANYLSCTSGRRASLFAALASELGTKQGPLPNITVSPVLEQTSVADFLRLLTSLQAKLDPALSSPLDNQLTHQSRKSVVSRGSDVSPLAMLFSNQATVNTPQASPAVPPKPRVPFASRLPPPAPGGPVNLPHAGQRRVSIAKVPTLLEPRLRQGRRFSLIPPMDVDHPSGQPNRKDILRLKKRSLSSQNVLQRSAGSTGSIPALLSSQRPLRSSLSGSAKYITTKLLSSDSTNSTSSAPQGIRRFIVRPVTSPESPVSSDNQNVPTKPSLPTITVEHVDSEPSNTEEDDENLTDVVVRL